MDKSLKLTDIATIKRHKRSLRLWKLCVLANAYYKYQIFYLNECLLKHDTDYKQAENTSMLINSIFNGETVPADFVKSQEESENELIEKHQDYQDYLNQSMLDKETVDAFCKASEHGKSSLLKINSIIFVKQIETLLTYNFGLITKEQAEKGILDYCIFSRKPKKLNTKLFKNTVYFIERLYNEIESKKNFRTQNKT
jgi:hypothetical protein